MPTLSDIAIVLRQWDFSETSQTVRLLTREHGPLRGLGKGARRERGMFSGGFEVCTRGQLVAIVKPGRDLATLTEWRLLEVFPGVRRRLPANRVALLAADLVAHLLDDGDPHPEVFDDFVGLLRGLERPGQEGAGLLRFQWRLLTATGYAPRLDLDAVTGHELDEDAAVLAFRPDAGGFTSDEAGVAAPGAWRLRRSTLETVRGAARDLEAGRVDHDHQGPVPVDDPFDRDDSSNRRDPHHPHHPPEPSTRHDPTGRANRLLATYVRHVVGREIPTIEWAFGD